jgi:hypothetical protein
MNLRRPSPSGFMAPLVSGRTVLMQWGGRCGPESRWAGTVFVSSYPDLSGPSGLAAFKAHKPYESAPDVIPHVFDRKSQFLDCHPAAPVGFQSFR